VAGVGALIAVQLVPLGPLLPIFPADRAEEALSAQKNPERNEIHVDLTADRLRQSQRLAQRVKGGSASKRVVIGEQGKRQPASDVECHLAVEAGIEIDQHRVLASLDEFSLEYTGESDARGQRCETRLELRRHLGFFEADPNTEASWLLQQLARGADAAQLATAGVGRAAVGSRGRL